MDSSIESPTMEISVQNVQSEIDQLTLSHMAIDVDVDRILAGEYNEAGRDLAIRMVQIFFKEFEEKLGPNATWRGLERALAYSKRFAFEKIVHVLPNTVEQATHFLLADATESGWYSYFEWDGIQEMLQNIFDGYDEDSSSYFDLKFFAETIYPAAREAGVRKRDLIGATTQIKKMRQSVAPIRTLLEWEKEKRITSKSADRAMRAIMKMVADPKISIAKFKKRMDKFRGIRSNRKEPLAGQMYILPQKTRIVIDVDNEKDLRFVEMALKGRVDLTLTNLQSYFDDVTKMLNLRTLKELIELREEEYQEELDERLP